MNFSDTAPSWEALQSLVEKRTKELNWQPSDLEDVSIYGRHALPRLLDTPDLRSSSVPAVHRRAQAIPCP